MWISIDRVEYDLDIEHQINEIVNIDVTPFNRSIWPENFILASTDMNFDHPICKPYSCSFLFKNNNDGPEFHQVYDDVHYFLLNRNRKFKIKTCSLLWDGS